MRTKRSYSVLSNKKCVVCGNNLKQNLIDKNPDAEYCFKHYKKIKKMGLLPKDIGIRSSSDGDKKMKTKNYSDEAKLEFPNAINDLEAMDLHAQKLYKELREMADCGQDSGKEYNRLRRKYRKVRDEYLEMRDKHIEEESSMEVTS